MTLPANVKKVLIIIAKNAVNAVLTNSALMGLMHGAFNMYSRSGWWNLGKATLAVVAVREVMVWGPVIVKWSKTNADPDELQQSLSTAAAATSKAGEAIADAQKQAPPAEVKS